MAASQHDPSAGLLAADVPEQGDVTRPGPDKKEFQASGLEQPLYFPLLKGQVVRLIQLNPGAWNDPVSIHLFIAELEHAPEYDAISYVWGDASQTTPIVCNGRRLDVTLSLNAAFKRIRLTYRPRIVWADAICINQTNTKEKSHHVAFMGDVYRHAKKVLVCMGRDTDGGAEDVASLVHDVSQMVSRYKSIADMPVLAANDPLYDDPRWKSLAVLHNLPWFTRAWVIQEVGLAKDPRILYGPVEFSYRDLMKLAAWTMKRAPNLETRVGVSFFSIHVEWANWTQDWRSSAADPENNLVDLLNQARWLGCRDPRDHIYSLLGHPLTRLEDGKTLIVQPDYDKDHMEVWFDLAVRLLETYGLRILSVAEHNDDQLAGDYPSWVPWCWPDEYTSCSLGAYEGFYFRADGGISSPPPKADPAVDERRQLHAQGIPFDVVKDSFKFTADDLAASPEKLRSMASAAEGDHAAESDGKSRLAMYAVWQHVQKLAADSATAYGDVWLTAFSLSLIAGCTTYDCAEDNLEKHHRDFGAYFRLWLHAVLGPSASEAIPTLPTLAQWGGGGEQGGDEGGNQGKEKGSLDDGDAEKFYVDFKLMCDGRSFFVTERGYFGIGLWNAKPGDLVALLFGAKCPFLLRKYGEEADGSQRYKLVQDAYVHGIMRGEAMEPFKKGEVGETHFIIC